MRVVTRTFGLGLVAGVLCAGLTVALPVQAGKAKRIRRAVALFPTQLGQEQKLKGKVKLDVRPGDDREKINVEVESYELPAGTVLDVWVVNPVNAPEPVLLGSVTLAANPRRPRETEGELEAKNYDGGILPAGVSPVSGITEYRVTPAGDSAAILLSNTNPGGNIPGGGERPLKRRIFLIPTPVGVETRSKGQAEIEVRSDGRQKFKVEVESKELAPGTTVQVEITHADHGSSGVGPLTLQPNDDGEVEGELEFDSKEGSALPAGAAPVNKITSVTVFLDGQPLLLGAF